MNSIKLIIIIFYWTLYIVFGIFCFFNVLCYLLREFPFEFCSLDVTDSDTGHGHYSRHQTSSPQVIGVGRGGNSGGVTLTPGRTTVTLPPSLRHQQIQQQQPRDRRSLPCQVADFSYNVIKWHQCINIELFL